MIITISTPDKFYMDQLIAFLTSIDINSPGHKVNVFLANYPKFMVAVLKNTFKNHNFESREVKPIDKRGIHFILFRIELIKECFDKGYSAAWIDTDVIVRGNLTPFLNIKPKQLKILYRGNKVQPKVRFNAGILNVGCSNITKEFIDDWYRRLKKNTIWGMGQLELWNSYKNNTNVELIEMSESFNDLGDSSNEDSFSSASLIWHSKRGHFHNEKFQKEFQYYLKKGQEKIDAAAEAL